MTYETLAIEFANFRKKQRDLDYLDFNYAFDYEKDKKNTVEYSGWIEVSCVQGSSEGWYVHFRGEKGLFALGKAWTIDAGIECVSYFTRLFHS